MAFSAGHGNVKVYWQGHLLIIEPESTFNVEGLIRAANQVKHLVETRSVREWIRVIYFRNTDIVGPVDGARYIIESVQHSRDNGCKMICVVGGNAMNRKGYNEVGAALGLPVHCFEDMSKLDEFVSKQLLEV